MRRRGGPEAPKGNRRRQFLSRNRSSRYLESPARSAAYRRAARRGRDEPKIGEDAIPARLTDNPLISHETAKEKVWKSLDFPWKKLGISLEFPWKSLEILGNAWRCGDRITGLGARAGARGRPLAALGGPPFGHRASRLIRLRARAACGDMPAWRSSAKSDTSRRLQCLVVAVPATDPGLVPAIGLIRQ